MSKRKRWFDLPDEAVIAEGQKYATRKEFERGCESAYQVACKRKLIDKIGFAENNLPSDDDAIYIWRAVGQYFNGEAVYKIGVTSARLGKTRIERVAKGARFDFEVICCTPVVCKASSLEKRLLVLGDDPCFIGIDGATEFRALSDSALWLALGIINGNKKEA